jgi:hypothetical protein
MRGLPEQVELLLEGLQGADTADTYKFHVERGYGSQYYDQVSCAFMHECWCARQWVWYLALHGWHSERARGRHWGSPVLQLHL